MCKWDILSIFVRGKITLASVSGPVEPCLPAGFNWDPRPQQIQEEGLGRGVRGGSGEVRRGDHFKSGGAGQVLVDTST